MDYEKQAQDWATKYGVSFQAIFAGHGKHHADDKDTRDVYQIILTRTGNNRPMSFEFGQSLVDSKARTESVGPYWAKTKRDIDNGKYGDYAWRAPNRKAVPPTLYTVIACITKSDPGTHEDFCSDFGYDQDSRKGLELYLAVQKEFNDFRNLCQGNHEMMTEAQEIQ